MHSENFDRVTIPCVTTLAKYISNIVSDPTEPKYRYINLANKVFQEKVVPTKYASDYLASIGFVTTPVDHKGIANPSLIYYPNKTVAVLIQQRIKLDELMARLNVPEEDRPKMKLKPQSQQTDSTSSSSVASLTSFDPYKVNITRTAQQVRIAPYHYCCADINFNIAIYTVTQYYAQTKNILSHTHPTNAPYHTSEPFFCSLPERQCR